MITPFSRVLSISESPYRHSATFNIPAIGTRALLQSYPWYACMHLTCQMTHGLPVMMTVATQPAVSALHCAPVYLLPPRAVCEAALPTSRLCRPPQVTPGTGRTLTPGTGTDCRPHALQGVTPSRRHCHTVMTSHCHAVMTSHSHSHDATLSRSHDVTLSHSHDVTLSQS